ncbi:uncharacterized protein LOC123698007 isoform X1 [Colias croceus]|uniref:uncharacterized protein LOC123698007 isoform X1 n=1 Tax=Colias crocea TaxID=72248 RepID=UPI001E27DC20|nr:uncharacterized protein LOC123698007 isoform X1 [Colias croceus]
MRKLLLLALLLYDVVEGNRLNNFDYDDMEKRHSFIDERRNWRKKALLKSLEPDHKDWDERRRYEQENLRYYDDMDGKPGSIRKGEYDIAGASYGNQKQLEEIDKAHLQSRYRSSETGHAISPTDKDGERKVPFTMNCERPHERYEACFSGCAAITCDNPRERLRPCYPFCEPGCICMQPYVRDDRTHKCVLPEDCTKGLKGIPDLGEDV